MNSIRRKTIKASCFQMFVVITVLKVLIYIATVLLKFDSAAEMKHIAIIAVNSHLNVSISYFNK